jgi:hypothetical protein
VSYWICLWKRRWFFHIAYIKMISFYCDFVHVANQDVDNRKHSLHTFGFSLQWDCLCILIANRKVGFLM